MAVLQFSLPLVTSKRIVVEDLRGSCWNMKQELVFDMWGVWHVDRQMDRYILGFKNQFFDRSWNDKCKRVMWSLFCIGKTSGCSVPYRSNDSNESES